MRKLATYGITLALVCSFMFSASADCVYERAVYGEDLQIGTMLHWSTAYEDDNSMFVVEKSTDGIEFNELGTVNGAGNSDEVQQYRFLDVNTFSPLAFYRLKQVDFDGSNSHSDILRVDKKHKNNFMVIRISTITVSELFSVTLDSFIEGEMTYQVKSWKGTEHDGGKLPIINGVNELSVEVAGLEEGIYKLFMTMDEEEEILTFRRVLSEDEKKQNVASTKNLKD